MPLRRSDKRAGCVGRSAQGRNERMRRLCHRLLRRPWTACGAGKADWCERISREIGAPVIDGVSAAVKIVEGLVSLGLVTSKIGDFAAPLPKPYKGLTSRFQPSP